MIIFKDAEKHEPKRKGTYLCIMKGQTFPFYEIVLWANGIWNPTLSYFKVVAFSETLPEQALKGISEDPEETVYGCENISADNHYCRMHESALSIKLPCECKKREDCKYNEYED